MCIYKGYYDVQCGILILAKSRCRKQTRDLVWWSDLNKQLADLVENYTTCSKFQKQLSEPLIPSVLPTLPWQKVARDLFKRKGATYLLIVDYFPKYIKISMFDNEISHEVIIRRKSIFARHGIQQQVIADNGPQYSSMSLLRVTILSTPPAALNFPRAMEKRRELSILPKHYFRKLRIHTQHYWHTG